MDQISPANVTLAACPFCGHSAAFRRDDSRKTVRIECTHCLIRTPECMATEIGWQTKLSIAWNSRQQTTQYIPDSLLLTAFTACRQALREIMVMCEDEEKAAQLTVTERVEEIGDITLLALLSTASMNIRENVT